MKIKRVHKFLAGGIVLGGLIAGGVLGAGPKSWLGSIVAMVPSNIGGQG